MSRVKIKFCGLQRKADIQFANRVQPDYIGFVFAAKSRRFVTAEQAKQLRSQLDNGIVPVGVFVNEAVETVVQLLENGIVDIAQLHGQEDEAYLTALRKRTEKPVWQAVRVRSQQDVSRAADSGADCILLDNGAGTGKIFDWTLAGSLSRPFFLAGGLSPENVGQAIAQVHPFGVDTSSGVETAGQKDFAKMRQFIQAVRAWEEKQTIGAKER